MHGRCRASDRKCFVRSKSSPHAISFTVRELAEGAWSVRALSVAQTLLIKQRFELVPHLDLLAGGHALPAPMRGLWGALRLADSHRVCCVGPVLRWRRAP